MSNETQKPQSPPVAAVPVEGDVVPVPKPSLLARTKQFVKDHKKPAIAVGALAALTGAAWLAGRNTSVTHEFNATLELENASPSEDEVEETEDTTVA